MCNKYVKFGAFLKKSLSMGADYVATGHYAKTSQLQENFSSLPTNRLGRAKNFPVTVAFKKKESFVNGDDGLPGYPEQKNYFFKLLKGDDVSKDQSYFLWTLGQEELSRILFPVGDLKKTEVRAKALKFGLTVAEKKDSQGICFLGPVDLKEFLAHYIKEKKGNVLNEKGEVIGYHNGATFLTTGERHGFTITKKSPSDKPFYVVSKDIKKNIITVSDTPKKIENSKVFKSYELEKVNWIGEIPKQDKKYFAQIRYHGEYLSCKVICAKSNLRDAEVIFDKSVIVSSGQSIVIYDKDVCLGGGIVK
jgi:tRNA-specific 2-thiouridylase